MTSASNGRALASLRMRRLTFADVAVVVVAAKPLLDAVSERTREVRFDLGSAWTLLALALLVIDVLRTTRVPLEAWVLRIAASVLVGLGIVRGLAEQNPSIALEWTRVAAGLAPAAILLGAAVRTNLEAVVVRWRLLFAASIGLHVGVAWLQFFGVLGTTYRQAGVGRPSGLYFHPMTLGYLLVAVILVVAIQGSRGRMPRWLTLLIAASAYATIVITTHRTSFLAGSFVLAAWMVIALLRTRRVRLAFLAVASTCVLLAGALGVLTSPAWSDTAARAVSGLSDVLTAEDLDVTSDRFLRGRGQRWMNAISLMGSGNTLETLFGFGYEVVDPHTDYLRLPLVHGLLGSFVVAAALAALWTGALRFCKGPWTRAWLIVAIAAMAIYAVTAKPTSYPSFMWAWTIVAVAAVGTERRARGLRGE